MSLYRYHSLVTLRSATNPARAGKYPGSKKARRHTHTHTYAHAGKERHHTHTHRHKNRHKTQDTQDTLTASGSSIIPITRDTTAAAISTRRIVSLKASAKSTQKPFIGISGNEFGPYASRRISTWETPSPKLRSTLKLFASPVGPPNASSSRFRFS